LNGTTWADIIHADQIVTNALSGGNATFTGTVNATHGTFKNDIIIRNDNGPDGLKLDSNGNILRWDGSNWVGLFASSHAVYTSSNYTVKNNDDIIICGGDGATITLPSNPGNGRCITVRNVGTSRSCTISASHTINIGGADTSHGDRWVQLNNDDRADLIFYGNVWYWNAYGT